MSSHVPETENTHLNSAQINALSDQCMLADRFRIRRRFQQIQRFDTEKKNEGLAKLSKDIERSVLLREQRQINLPKIDYPDLPVTEQKDKIAEAIRDNQVVIIAGETGSGKTTQIPKICLELGRGVAGLIGHTQPRRLAARSVANRIAEELHTELGNEVGFKIRFSDQVSERTYVKLMTDGILLAEIQQDSYLKKYDTIIIDEAHERSLNIDFILGILKQLLPKRPDLKLIITSATIDPERFSKHFDNAPIIQVSGRTFPVEMRYRPLLDDSQENDRDQAQAIIDAVNELGQHSQGDILVFLSGERDIRDMADALTRQQFRHTEVVPLYARLSAAEQNKIFQTHSGRRIVLATNVAETSLTVPGIKYVIDPGTARISRYSVRSKVQRLPIEAISQASANQRAGRCGRVSNGICIRLYSEEDFNNRDEFTDPEILRTNLASVILQMLALGLGKIDQFPFVQMPDSRSINDGFNLLEELGGVEKNTGRLSLTTIGRQMARLPIDPRYARMIVEAEKQNSMRDVTVITAGLSIQDPRERPQDKRQAADEKHQAFANKDSDFLALLTIWHEFKAKQTELTNNQLRKWCKQHFINYLRMREWQDIVSQLKKSIAELGFRISQAEADYQAIHQAMAAGLLSHIGNKDKNKEYLGARNSRFMLFPGSGIAKTSPKWLMVAELVDTSRLFGRMGAKIEPQWLESLAPHLIKRNYSEPHWSKKQGVAQAFESVTLYGLPLVTKRRVAYSQIDPVVSREIFIREALVNQDTKLQYDFLIENQLEVDEIKGLEDKTRRRDLLVDEDALVDFYAEHIPSHVCSEASFKKWWSKARTLSPDLLTYSKQMLLKNSPSKAHEYDFPETWQQGNLTLRLDYHFNPTDVDDGVSLLVPLSLLNQLTISGFDWLVPGLRSELIITLIKLLPKRLRRNFVPAPNYAEACLADITPIDSHGQSVTFLSALSLKLKRMTGVDVSGDDWQIDNLPLHLRFNFKVLDENNSVLKQGRDLLGLQHELQGKVKQSLSSIAKPGLEKTGITQWDFDTLPKEYVSKQSGFNVKAYPALVPEKSSVAIKLFDKPHIAESSHQLGLRQLISLSIPSPIKYLHAKLPNKAKLGLYFNPFGRIDALIDDVIAAAIDELIKQYQSQHEEIRTALDFEACCTYVRSDINDHVLAIAQKVEVGLTKAHQIKKKMKGNVPLSMINAYGDIKQHLDSLVFSGFVSDIGSERLNDWQRYIEGIARRIEKLPIDPTKDRLHQLNVEKVQQAYTNRLQKIPAGVPLPQELAEVRWMIEELRVSFFAQQLGTAMPISTKRIINQLEAAT
ncbi:ATP-dependent RNA helicase HrpA [Paraglaciecola sp. L1A13]|uniref:ATP-dependent RNA helicase HrpA n=1 Tax=Paraglaciecola sp. L1A13 TaxID=2686359 RepID=UPI00131E833C|nr:ATP-dependent RNA helicase HrpA [Paraglaciecola sp. L1A13]